MNIDLGMHVPVHLNNERLHFVFPHAAAETSEPSFNVTLLFTFCFPGNVFCHDELLMSALVEGSVVSENRRVTLFRLFSSHEG